MNPTKSGRPPRPWMLAAGVLACALAGRPAHALPAGATPDTAVAAPDTAQAGERAAMEPAAPGGASMADMAGIPAGWLWVTRGSLVTPGSIDTLVARAQAAGIGGLLVQVVGRGDAYYHSDLLPRAEALPRNDFDPLDRVLSRAHAAGIEVHAWINCVLVWSAPWRPRDPRHVLNQHPEWIARLPDGRRMTQVSAAERRRLGVEGVYLAPAHPAVRAWIASVAAEIARRYPVDGIHLDYIRDPGPFVGYDPDTRAHFAMETGIDPLRFAALDPARRAAIAPVWAAFQRAQVTAVVRQVRDSLAAARATLPLSAAVLADTVSAERAHAQSWREWVRTGLLDRVFVMCYAPGVQTVLDEIVAYARDPGRERVVPGIAVFNTRAGLAAAKVRGARELGYPAVALYSYDALAHRPDDWRVVTQPFDDFAHSGARARVVAGPPGRAVPDRSGDHSP
jgi:uncharacterized lipoprotein YddW (UPF0748 family)